MMTPDQWPHLFDREGVGLQEINASKLPRDLPREAVALRFLDLLKTKDINTPFVPVIFSDDVASDQVNLTIAFEEVVPATTIRLLEQVINAEMRERDLMADYNLIPTVNNIYELARVAMGQSPPKDPGPPSLA